MLISDALRLPPSAVVALTGAGGKTTLMFRLADELLAAGRTVVTTMTTHLFVGQMAIAPAHLAYVGEAELLAALPAALHAHRHVLVAGGILVAENKVSGLPPQVIDVIAASGLADALIVEADGARRLPFKAPAAHEPVVPGSTTHLVPVAGLDVIGRPLTGDTVHRPEIIAELAGIAAGDVVTPEVVATVLAHPAGGAKGLPDGARFIPFLNKAHDPSALAAGRAVARRLLVAPQVDAVVLGAVGTDQAVREVWGWAGAVVLAAGQGRRFGSLKQVQPWRGLPLVAHVVSQALHCPDVAKVVVTVGAEAEMVTQAAREAGPVTVVRVPDWAEGQSRSVQTGLSALQGCSAALFLLADQPAVTPELLSALIQRHRETLAPIVAPRYAGQRGNPVLFDAATFPEFVSLHGDIGARPIIRRHEAEIAWLDWPSPDILSDIDTRADYDAAF